MATKKQDVKSSSDFPKISAPATRALHGAGYTRLEQLNGVSAARLAKLHGVGPKALGELRRALEAAGMAFDP